MRKHVFLLLILFVFSLLVTGCSNKLVIQNQISEALTEDPANGNVLYARDNAARLSFGQSFCISGSYLIAGSPGTNSNQGQVCILKNGGDHTWQEVTKLEKSYKTKNDFFGYSVSLSGNYAMIGVPGYNAESGQVYICKNEGADKWKEVGILTANPPEKIHKHFFGCSVSLEGDYAIIGANSSGKATGLAYIFKNDGTGHWKQISVLGSGDKSSADNFGFSVSLYKDYAIVGAPTAGSGGKNRGQAHIFKNDGAGNWKEIAVLTSSDQADDDYFGRKVCLYENYAIVGAPTADSGYYDQGQAYIFKNDEADNWKEVAILKASDQMNEDHFGNSVFLFANQAIVGAPGSHAQNGQAYVFKNTGADRWQEVKIIKPGAKPLYHHFGMDVSLTGEYAVCTALTAASYNDEKRGGIYLFPQESLHQGAHIAFESQEYDLGRISADGEYKFAFPFTNTGSEPLTVLEVKSSCACTVLDKQEKNILQPGESSQIKGTFYSKQYNGSVMRGIYIKTNDPEQAEIYLNINAIIE